MKQRVIQQPTTFRNFLITALSLHPTVCNKMKIITLYTHYLTPLRGLHQEETALLGWELSMHGRI
jgi:hypothetical protein